MSILFITHDLTLIDGFAHKVMIMYAGRILEQCLVEDIHTNPWHPYTKDLLRSIPRMGYFKDTHTLFSIKGNVPELYNLPVGCKYAPRCEHCFEHCLKEEPPLFQIAGHNVRCWLYEKENIKT